MTKNLNKFVQNNLFLLIAILIYLVLILGWYYKLPWTIDHNMYLHIAKALNIQDLSFWNLHRSSLPEGHHNERWAILSLIIIFDKLLFFLTPGTASQVLIVSVHVGMMISIYYILINFNNRITANLFLIFWLFAGHFTKNRATEILLEPFAVLFLCFAILSLIFLKRKKKFIYICIAAFALVSIPLIKIHLGIFSLMIFIIFFDLIKKNFKQFLICGFATIIFYNFVLLINYGFDLYKVLIENSINVYKVYFIKGLAVGRGPDGNGWVNSWLSLVLKPTFIAPIFFLSAIFIFSRKYQHKYIFGWLFVVFLITIFILTSYSNFPANTSYAQPLQIFSIICLAILVGEFFDEKKKNLLKYLLIILFSVVPLLSFYFLGGYKTTNFYNSFYSLTIVSTLIFLPYIYLRRTNISFYLLVVILSTNIFWHNWENITRHSTWKTSYNYHYIHFRAAADLIKKLDNEKVAVHFTNWPITWMKKRERSYIEPGIRSLIRNDVDIHAYLDDDKIIWDENFDYLILDKLVDQFKLVDSINVTPFSYKTKGVRFFGNKFYLYKIKN